MGILSKIFRSKGKGSGVAVKRSRAKQLAKLNGDTTPLPEVQFWKIISSAAKKKKSLKQWEVALEKKLTKLKLAELVAFQLRVDELLLRSYHEDLLCACAILEGTTDSTSFDGFRCWLIMHGKNVFEKALNNPDAITELLTDDVEDHYFPSLKKIALDLFLKQSGKTAQDAASYKTPPVYPELYLNWKLHDPDSMRSVCPRLWEHAHNR
jgi:hypothetical protein